MKTPDTTPSASSHGPTFGRCVHCNAAVLLRRYKGNVCEECPVPLNPILGTPHTCVGTTIRSKCMAGSQ